MVEILLMRHAKSEHPAGIADRDRPLSSRGRAAAAAMGRTMSGFGVQPDLILTSPARRAASTARRAAAAGGWDAPLVEVEDLYGGGVSEVLRALEVEPAPNRVLAVGHEPTWSATVAALVGGGSFAMVTAAVACIEAPGPIAGSGRLRWMLHPRLLPEASA